MAKRKAAKVEAVDGAVADAVKPYAGSTAVRAVSLLSEVGDQPQMRLLCGAVIAAGLVGGDRRLARAGVRMLAAHTLATAAKNFMKRRIDRTRPRSKDRPGKDHRIAPGRNEAKEETSFPSGHSAGAAAVARAFARDYPEHAAPAYAAAAAIALAQIPRCAHYPTDIAAGLALGAASEALIEAASGLLTPKNDSRPGFPGGAGGGLLIADTRPATLATSNDPG